MQVAVTAGLKKLAGASFPSAAIRGVSPFSSGQELACLCACSLFVLDKGKPVERPGRKAMGRYSPVMCEAGRLVAERMLFSRSAHGLPLKTITSDVGAVGGFPAAALESTAGHKRFGVVPSRYGKGTRGASFWKFGLTAVASQAARRWPGERNGVTFSFPASERATGTP